MPSVSPSSLKPGVAHLFFAHPLKLLSAAPSHARWLSLVERQKAERFRQPGDKERYRATRVLVRGILAGFLGRSPTELTFVEGAHGRPGLEGGTALLDFNASRCPSWVALAVTSGVACGVDVEDVSRKADFLGIARAFAPEELALLEKASVGERPRLFFALWTLKEAALKGLGCGLTLSLGACAFRLEEGRPPEARFTPSVGDDVGAWSFAQVAPDAKHLLALAVRSATLPQLVVHGEADTCAAVAAAQSTP